MDGNSRVSRRRFLIGAGTVLAAGALLAGRARGGVPVPRISPAVPVAGNGWVVVLFVNLVSADPHDGGPELFGRNSGFPSAVAELNIALMLAKADANMTRAG
jgi:hypothetical protein